MSQEVRRQVNARRRTHNPVPASPGKGAVVQPLGQMVGLYPFNPQLQQKAIQAIESDAMKKLDSHIRPFAERGEAIPDKGIDQIRGELRESFKVSGTRFNDLLFTAIKRIGDEGNPRIYEFFKKRRPDGTPGMYFIPAWKEKIGQAQRHARKVASAKG